MVIVLDFNLIFKNNWFYYTNIIGISLSQRFTQETR